ncbi:energy transducer TonB [Flavobacterium sp. WC2509]|uniref:energy transducer TonB n=1 Tax=Flavobacterium sp. WC2509 TaxID=3461406 RepID=UPI00404456AF
MKSILLTLFFLPLFIFSQNNNEKKIYLDSLWNESTEANYKYYQIIEPYDLEKKLYKIKNYYKSSVLQMEGYSKSGNYPNNKEKECVFYYENGNKKSVENYHNNRLLGKDEQWYKNGTKKSEGEYFEDEKHNTQHKLNQFWDVNGIQKVVDNNGYFEDKEENESSKGAIKNGFKDGDWEGQFLNFKSSYKETYKDGKLISGESWDSNKKSYLYTEVEIRPEPKGGIMEFYQYIGKNFRTPKNMPKGTSGKINVKFVVEKDGTITQPIIIKDLGYGTGMEAVRVLTNYNDFNPAEQRGQKTTYIFQQSIKISGQ